MNWGKSIVLVFILFAGFIGTMVYRMSREHIDLVRDDYYQDEIAYQKQIDRTTRTARLSELPKVNIDPIRQQLDFKLPPGWEQATLTLYRPSDRQQDRIIKLKSGQKTVSTAALASGFWRVKLSWLSGGEEFYYEQDFTKP